MPNHSYPRRDRCFAYRYCRLLFKTCAAQDLGVDAVLLLICIAMTEDAKRYTGPVTYFNEQLMSILGFGRWERLDRARKAAKDWLHYEPAPPGIRRFAPKYWVQIPREYENLDDSPTDESGINSESYPSGGQEFGNSREEKNIESSPSQGDKSPSHPPLRGTTKTLVPTRQRGESYPSEGEGEGYGEGEPSSLTLSLKKEETTDTLVSRKPEDTSGGTSDEVSARRKPRGIFFLTKGEGKFIAENSLVEEYQNIFPHLDVKSEIKKAASWCKANPPRRKTLSGMKRFLSGWLLKADMEIGKANAKKRGGVARLIDELEKEGDDR